MKMRLVAALLLFFAAFAGTTTFGAKQAEAQLITPYFIAMLAGPVSDGSSVILVKKRENFISWETPLIACTSGAGAGLIAAGLPQLFTLATTGVWLGIDWGEALILSIYGCVVSGVGGIGGALTELGLVSFGGGH